MQGAMIASLVFGGGFKALAEGQVEQPEKDWTILIFLNGHNNLSSYGVTDVNEMETVGSTDKVNVVVQLAQTESMTRRYFIEKDSDTSEITSPVAMDMEKRVDMGDYRELVDFVKWGVANYPAKKYFVTVWNHGGGWHRKGLSIRDISGDDYTGNIITTEQLGVAMSEIATYLGRKIDIYGSDACLMNMLEVGAEMSDSVDVMIGSQDLEPGQGWPYGDFLYALKSSPTEDPLQLGKILTDKFVNSYSGGSQGSRDVTLSTIDLRHMDQFLISLRNLSSEIVQLPKEQHVSILSAIESSEAFYYMDYRDMGQLFNKLSPLVLQESTISDLKLNYQSLVYYSQANGYRVNATGLSMWMPNTDAFDKNESRYAGLKSDKASGWGEALRTLLK